MRWITILAVLCFVTGCEKKEKSQSSQAEKTPTKSIEKISKKKDDTSSKAPKLSPLQTPLPGNVMPTFEYSKLMDMTVTAPNTKRSVSLQVRGVAANEALKSLAVQWAKAGYKTKGAMTEKKSVVQNFWVGGESGLVTQIVAAGGTHVMVIARPYDSDSSGAKDGFSGALIITINSK